MMMMMMMIMGRHVWTKGRRGIRSAVSLSTRPRHQRCIHTLLPMPAEPGKPSSGAKPITLRIPSRRSIAAQSPGHNAPESNAAQRCRYHGLFATQCYTVQRTVLSRLASKQLALTASPSAVRAKGTRGEGLYSKAVPSKGRGCGVQSCW